MKCPDILCFLSPKSNESHYSLDSGSRFFEESLFNLLLAQWKELGLQSWGAALRGL